jgi:hypothetical protein
MDGEGIVKVQAESLAQAVADEIWRGKRSVRYLRVSSRGQMDTDSHLVADGNSIDSQRKATVAKEEAMGLTNVGEYIEPGNSGQSIEGRPVFQELLKCIREQRDIEYVVFDMRSRGVPQPYGCGRYQARAA